MRCLLAILLICASASPQLQQGSDISHKDSGGKVLVRINVSLVQLDAAVTDSTGRPVPGLTPNDFEVLQDGVSQPITAFSYIADGVKSSVAMPQRTPAPTGSVPAPADSVASEPIRRQIVLLVDDLGLSPTGIAYTRAALKKFVERDMQSQDVVAIVRTSGGVGALQQFTTDKSVLYAAIQQLKFHFIARAANFTDVDLSRSLERPTIAGSGQERARYSRAEMLERCRRDTMSADLSFAAIRYIVQGVRDLPGRKALILFSENLQISDRPDRVNSDNGCLAYKTLHDMARRVTDAAERSAVVIYTIDPHGLDPLVGDAAANPFAKGPLLAGQSPVDVLNQQLREAHLADSFAKSGLQMLAEATGGTFVSQNDIVGAIREAANDLSHYYLLGYRPPASTFEGADPSQRFHKVTVKVKRPGLRVRSRIGFYGFPTRDEEAKPLSTGQWFAHMLLSPFSRNDLRLSITPLFLLLGKPVITTFVYINAEDLTSPPAQDGGKKTVEIACATFDKNGTPVFTTQNTYAIALSNPAQDSSWVAKGVILKLQHAVEKPGPYQVKVVARDAGSGRTGSASQFFEVPDLNQGRLALSGILLKGSEEDVREGDDSIKINRSAVSADVSEAIHIFKLGDTIRWYYEVFNAKTGIDQRTNLRVRVRVFRDGVRFVESQPASAHLVQDDPSAKYVATSGHMVLGTNFTPGDYALQLLVTDELARSQYATASQLTGFQIAKP